MGKYIKKARSGRGVMEVITQGSSGMRTRARSQAMQELVKYNHSNVELRSSTSMQSFAPAQISYLQLRSRKLEKLTGIVSDKMPLIPKTTAFAGEYKRLSDFTYSEVLPDDASPRLALFLDEVQHTRRQNVHQEYGESLYFHGDSEAVDESSLQGFTQRSLHKWTSEGRAPPIAHSRSNSRSNSLTREFPLRTQELLPHGILTRNQRKLETQGSDANACSNKATDSDVETEGEISPGGAPRGTVWSAISRSIQEEAESSNAKECNAHPFTNDIKPSQSEHGGQAANLQSPLDKEIEEFFFQAEQQVHRHFRDRYNFDSQNEIPLPGPYDWVKL